MSHRYDPNTLEIIEHDRDCPWTQIFGAETPCPDDLPAKYTFLCACEAIEASKRDMLAKCIEVAKEYDAAFTVSALRALQEKP